LQRHESNVFESIELRERNAERALRRQAEENQLQAMYLRGQLADAQRALTMQAEGNQIQATHLRGQIMNAEGRLMDQLTTALQAPVPLALVDKNIISNRANKSTICCLIRICCCCLSRICWSYGS
jgi:hypothetical protein